MLVCRRHSDDGITGVKAVAASTNIKRAIIQQTLALCANAKFVAAMIVFRVHCSL
jgi:DNA-binding IscR family transcriptional regulator